MGQRRPTAYNTNYEQAKLSKQTNACNFNNSSQIDEEENIHFSQLKLHKTNIIIEQNHIYQAQQHLWRTKQVRPTKQHNCRYIKIYRWKLSTCSAANKRVSYPLQHSNPPETPFFPAGPSRQCKHDILPEQPGRLSDGARCKPWPHLAV